MKTILILLSLFIHQTAIAKTDHLVCLGAEEAYIHKNKIGGAYKKLNLALVNEVIMFSENIKMDEDLLKLICARNDNFPSLEVLKYSFLGKKTFYSKIKNIETIEYSIDSTALDSFREASKYIFINFLTDLQSEVKDPHCLVKEFPELKDFFLKAKHILVDVGIEKLISEIKNKKKMFQKLQSISWKENCR